ncbi:MAG TPA: hypothetical protein VKT33_14925 [Candidatus Angelobacter sp.]|nr:hypothetical protein [Candidatus Angelobacter sp.]
MKVLQAEESRGTAAPGCAPVVRVFTTLVQILRTTLREIFDENAYDRFLARTHRARSAESYQAFMREREVGMAKRPRCC